MPPRVIYGNPITGSDAYSGLTQALAKRTLYGINAVATAGDRVSLAGGVYLIAGGSLSLSGHADVLWMPDGSGDVVVDFENTAIGAADHIQCNGRHQFIGIKFRNPAIDKYCIASISVGNRITLRDCVFYQRDGAANTGRGVGGYSACFNCSFYNLALGISNHAWSEYKSNYLKDVTTIWSGTASTHDYNAYPGNTETHGIDTDDPDCDPGFVDATAEDFRLSPTNPVAIGKFRTLGKDGGPIGAAGTCGIFYDARWAQTRYIAPVPTPTDGCWPAWGNDDDYDDPDGAEYTGVIVEDPTTYEPIIDLATYPDARSAALISPIWDLAIAGDTHIIEAMMFSAYQDLLAGAALDIDTTLPLKFQYRSSNTAFGGSPPAWVDIAYGTTLDDRHRYIQARIIFRTNHTNA